jgi:hypothetical protein
VQIKNLLAQRTLRHQGRSPQCSPTRGLQQRLVVDNAPRRGLRVDQRLLAPKVMKSTDAILRRGPPPPPVWPAINRLGKGVVVAKAVSAIAVEATGLPSRNIHLSSNGVRDGQGQANPIHYPSGWQTGLVWMIRLDIDRMCRGSALPGQTRMVRQALFQKAGNMFTRNRIP